MTLLAIGFVACPGPVSAASTQQVTIVRDAAGIPHITAQNFRALGYGEAWAFSQDNFCLLAQAFVTVNGERSKYFGPKALTYIYPAGTSNTNLDSDLFWKSVASSAVFKTAMTEMHQPPPLGPLPEVMTVDQGFVAGYNAYLASGRLNDATCKGKAWVQPIDLKDIFLREDQLLMEASSEQFIKYEVAATPPAPSSATASVSARGTSSPRASVVREAFDEDGTLLNPKSGSNAVAIGSQDTAGGDGMVLANPHVPWEGTDRLWLVQLTVPGQYNVEGTTVPGIPLVLFGFNRDLAWTETSSTDFHFTFFQLKLVPGDPTSYLVDGKAQKMTKQTVTVDTGHHHSVRHSFYSTRWGPVINVALPGSTVGLKWTTTTAYAVDDSLKNDLFRAGNEYLRMGQASSVKGLLSAQSQYLAIPYFNTVAGDDTGHVYYGDVENTPNVPTSLIKSCMPSGLAQLVYGESGIVTLDGSRTACAWKTDPGTPVPGIFDAAQMPHTIRTDYVDNSNNSYWLANPSAPLPAYPPIIGKTDTIQNLRTRLGNHMIAERIAGTDGLGKPKFTLDSLQAMWENEKSALAQLVLPSLVSDCEATPSAKASDGTVVDLSTACKVLTGYNGTGNLDAIGGWLFSEWAAFAPSATVTGPTSLWADSFNAAQPLTTPSQLNTANPQVLDALADAVENLEQHHVPLDASIGQVQHVTRNGTTIPIPGCSTCYSAIAPYDGQNPLYKGFSYGQVDYGNSWVMITELTPHGPVGRGILAYSEATNPKSPWYANMTKLYSQKRWVSLAFTSAQLAREHGLTKTVLPTS